MQENDVVVASPPLQQELLTHIRIPLSTYKQIQDFLKIQYLNNEESINHNEVDDVSDIVLLGLICSKMKLEDDSGSLLHKGHKPRADVYRRFGMIAQDFLKHSEYPNIPSSLLRQSLHIHLGSRDMRVLNEYKKTVLLYCNVSEDIIDRSMDYNTFGILYVSHFVESIPKKYLGTKV